MTRMEKWQSYRDEIAKQAKISQDIDLDKTDIQKFETEINKINPAILSNNLEKDPAISKGVSNVEVEEKQISTEIFDLFSTINKAANTINQDRVKTIFDNIEKDKIIGDGKKIKEEWLEQNPNYSWFKKETSSLKEQHSQANENLAKQLEEKYNTFKSKPKKQTVEPVMLYDKTTEKNTSHYVFVISIAVSALLLLIVLALFITKMVLR